MITINSKLEGATFPLYEMEQKLKPLGFDIGGGWDYDHGYFDYKMESETSYHYVRIPVKAVDGQLNQNGAIVKIEAPFVLNHEFQSGIDDDTETGLISGSFDQFQEPKNPDGNVEEIFVQKGKEIIDTVEQVLM